MSNISINESYLYFYSNIISMLFPSSSGIFIDSISSSVSILDSTISTTDSTKTLNSIYI